MRSFSIKTPLSVQWHLTTPGGNPFSLAGYTFTLRYKTGRGMNVAKNVSVPADDEGHLSNIIVWDFSAEEQTFAGIYDLELSVYRSGKKLITSYYTGAFSLERFGHHEPRPINTHSNFGNMPESDPCACECCEAETVHLFSAAEWWIYKPIEPTCDANGIWSVNGHVVLDEEGNPIPAYYSFWYDRKTFILYAFEGSVDLYKVEDPETGELVVDVTRASFQVDALAEFLKIGERAEQVIEAITQSDAVVSEELSDIAVDPLVMTMAVRFNSQDLSKLEQDQARKNINAAPYDDLLRNDYPDSEDPGRVVLLERQIQGLVEEGSAFVGDMSKLKTEHKDFLVNAINDNFDKTIDNEEKIGDLESLTTAHDNHKDLVNAINSNYSDIGQTRQLKTVSKNLTEAVNEIFDGVKTSPFFYECTSSEFDIHKHAGITDPTKPFHPVVYEITEEFFFEDVKYPKGSWIYGVTLVPETDVLYAGTYTYAWKVLSNAQVLIGVLENLTTINKDNIVTAINELDEKQGDDEIEVEDRSGVVAPNLSGAVNELARQLGNAKDITDTDSYTAVDAINKLFAEIGELPDLTTEDKENVVAAINFIMELIGNVNELTPTINDTLVKAINSNKTEIGVLSDLDDEFENDNLVSSLNEAFNKSKVEVTEDTTQERYANIFTFKQNNNLLAEVRVPKDYYINSAVLYQSTGTEVLPDGSRAKDTEGNNLVKDKHYIRITIAQNSEILYANVEKLYNPLLLEEDAPQVQLSVDEETGILMARIIDATIEKEDLVEELQKTLDFSGWINTLTPLDTEAQTLRGGVNELKGDLDDLREEFGKIADIALPDDAENATQTIQWLIEKKAGYKASCTYEEWLAGIRSSADSGVFYVISNDFVSDLFGEETKYKAGTWLLCIDKAAHTWIAMNNGGAGIETLIKEVETLPALADAKSDVIYVVSAAGEDKAYIKLDAANKWMLLNGGSSGGGTWLGNTYYYEDEHANVPWETFFTLTGQTFLTSAATALKGSAPIESDIISLYTDAHKPATGDAGTYFGQYIFKNNVWESYSQQAKATKNAYGVTKLATDEEFVAGSAEFPATPDQILDALDNYAVKDDVYLKPYIDNLMQSYYTKEQTYTKVEIEGLIANIRQVKHVENVAAMRADAKSGTLYYVGVASPYEQYLCISATDFLDLGSTDIDLSDYYKKQAGVTDACIGTLANIDTTKTIQQQLDAKMEAITGAASSVVTDNLEKGMVVVSNAFTGKIDVSDRVSASELNQLDGIDTTKTIQAQLDEKVAASNVKTVNNVPVVGTGDISVQDVLVSGTNIKTINNNSILGSGNLEVQEKLVSGVNVKTIDGKNILVTDATDTDIAVIEEVTRINNTLAENKVYHLIGAQGGYEVGGYYIRSKYTDPDGNPQDDWVRMDNVVRADTVTTVNSLVALGSPLTTTIYRLKTNDGTYEPGYYMYYKNDAAGPEDMGTGFICLSKDAGEFSAGTGLTLTPQKVLNHSNSVAAATEVGGKEVNGGIEVAQINYDTEGHITGSNVDTKVFAATTAGTKGQILMSGGSNTKPEWVSASPTYYGTCSTDAATQAKDVTCEGFVLAKGAIIAVYFSAANTIAAPQLNVNTTGAKSIYLGNTTMEANKCWGAGSTCTFVYDGTYYRLLSIDTPTCLYGVSSTAAGTAAKTADVKGFKLYTGAVVYISFSYPHVSATAATLNVSSTGAYTIHRWGNNITTNNGTSWLQNDLVGFVFDGTYWQMMEASNVPVGTIAMFGGANIPAGWLYCNGTTVSRTTYNKLYAVIGTNFGSGDGSTTFTLPDFRQRFPEGAGNGGLVGSQPGLGGKVAPGIPDIFGYYGTARGLTNQWGVNQSGATYDYGQSGTWGDGPGSSGDCRADRMGFRASRGEVPSTSSTSISNNVYGKSATVQPAATAVHFMIRWA